MAKVTVELEGFNDALKLLRALPTAVQRRILRSGARKALKPVQVEAQSKVPKSSGNLKNAIRIRVAKDAPRSEGAMMVAVFKGRGEKYDGWYGHIVEGGHKGIVRDGGKRYKRGERFSKDVPAQHFFDPAVDNNQDMVIETYWENVIDAIGDRVKRHARKTARGR